MTFWPMGWRLLSPRAWFLAWRMSRDFERFLDCGHIFHIPPGVWLMHTGNNQKPVQIDSEHLPEEFRRVPR